MRCALFLCFLLASVAALLPTPPAAVVSASRRYVPRLAPRGVHCQTDPEEIEQEKPVNDSPMVDDPPTERVCSFPGCDGNGRVLGGLAAWGPTSWWPIKAYRPCPTCAAEGRRYVRSGQTLDEIVFKKNPAGGYYGDDDD
ncbi:hypothetical protein AB1Y20_009905 [Prymnesium parvum]|uniref:Uncharacterized protein n=1 Tax=Prymnesium parvum TaxID=97485 RepID=A0AB34K5D2_PRYPA|mmetsp:Transcript_6207/g.15718  ORF Transcript_6207/g.15718 Transcript_6207/m.15718 type:complete len:140 (-) Transcript_6207:489-908(-)